MNPDPIGLIRTALVLKASNIQRAGKAYVRDQASHGKNVILSYVIGASLLFGAAIFAIVAILIGANALFRFIEIRYGLFEAFGVVGGATVVLALILAAIGLLKIRSKPKPVIPLASRVRVAAHSHPITKENVKVAALSLADQDHRNMTLGVAAVGTLLAYVLLRRR